MTDMNSIFGKNTADWFAGALWRTDSGSEGGLAPPLREERIHWCPLLRVPARRGLPSGVYRQAYETGERGTLTKAASPDLYLPLKSLAADIRENLRRPLDGLAGQGGEEIEIAIRTGDTPPRDRQRMIKYPPHILITTPESLYLMLTSKTGQGILATAKAIILDELHALIDTRQKGEPISCCVRSQVDKICSQPLQRIGLSATIEPLFHGGGLPVSGTGCHYRSCHEKEVQLYRDKPVCG